VIRREGDRMMIAGPATLANVTQLLDAGLSQVREGVTIIDLAEVTELDSSLLAATLAWLREARRLNRALCVANMPKGLQTLAQLYGVEGLLPPAAARH